MNATLEMPLVQAKSPRLSKNQLEEFVENGFVLVHDVFTEAEMDAVNDHLQELKVYADQNGGVTPYGFRFTAPIYKKGVQLGERHSEPINGGLEKDPFFYKWIRDPRLLDLAEQIIGPNIKFYTAQAGNKAAFVGTPHAWHQDPAYWQSHGPAYFSFWISLDGADLENACVEFIPGSHKLGLLKTVPRPIHREPFMRHNYEETTPPWTVPTVEGAPGVDIDFSKRVPAILPKGSLSIHNSVTVHTSGHNASSRQRGCLIFTYIQADLPRRDGKPCSLPVLRGRSGLIPSGS